MSGAVWGGGGEANSEARTTPLLGVDRGLEMGTGGRRQGASKINRHKAQDKVASSPVACEKLLSNLGFLPRWLCSAQGQVGALTWVKGRGSGAYWPLEALQTPHSPVPDPRPGKGTSLYGCNGDTGGIHTMWHEGLSVSLPPQVGRSQRHVGVRA